MIVIESLNHVNLPAKDLAKSVEFYSMFLDFEEISMDQETAVMSFDDKIHIKLVKTEDQVSAASLPIFSFILDVDDFTEALQEIEGSGIKIISGPNEINGGENVVIADPSGNPIELYYQD